LEFLAHAIEGGFYYIDTGEMQMTVPEHLGVVTVADQEPPLSLVVTAELLRNEFTQMMPGHEWSVREISPSEFAVPFPSVEILRFYACSTTLTLPINKLQVSVRPSSAHPDTTSTLSSVWVRILGFLVEPEIRTPEIVELMSQAIGKLIEIDARTLCGTGPIRIRVLCPDLAQLSIILPPFYFGAAGRSLTVELDDDLPASRSPPRPSDPPSDGPDGREGDSSGDDSGSDEEEGGALEGPSPGVSPAPPHPDGTSHMPSRTQTSLLGRAPLLRSRGVLLPCCLPWAPHVPSSVILRCSFLSTVPTSLGWGLWAFLTSPPLWRTLPNLRWMWRETWSQEVWG
jgi:hypothetical protein